MTNEHLDTLITGLYVKVDDEIGRLSAPLEGTARCAQNRARLVLALYTRLDRLTEPLPAAP
ncbi:hypothetical protein [Streptomyces sp. NPDC093149]|uniref:hypothetical protein n=1 Tax=Streptomyces sp. NPDC093149 TaxID=3366031 RepID=UPI00382726DA